MNDFDYLFTLDVVDERHDLDDVPSDVLRELAIDRLQRRDDDATQDAVREALAAQWEGLRTALQVVALSEAALRAVPWVPVRRV